METTPSRAPENSDPIRVMLIDDSAVVRGLLTRSLESNPDVKIVGSCPNGEAGVNMVARAEPDVIILDVEMPIMDGLTALPKLLALRPQVRIVMCSSLTEKGAAITMKAMQLGAVECIAKPSSNSVPGAGSDFQRQLLGIVRGLGAAARKARPAPSSPARPATGPAPAARTGQTDPLIAAIQKGPKTFPLRNNPADYRGKPALIAIGSSTGGPQALFEVTKNLKGLDMPIVLTQHMPATFTKILAQHIEQQSGIPSCEGAEGMRLEKGRLYVAPGGLHMELAEKDGGAIIHLSDAPPENFCKPAVDPMMRSAVKIYGRKVLGVILTGMGQDGLVGGKALVEAGGRLIAQDEASSVVWGMPGAVAMAGLCSAVLPLKDLGPWVRNAAMAPGM